MRPITQTEQAAWQRIAALALTEILDEHRTLPIANWRVAGGQQLMAYFSTFADDPVGDFEAWRTALALPEPQVSRDSIAETHRVLGVWTTKRGGHSVKLGLVASASLPEDEAVA